MKFLTITINISPLLISFFSLSLSLSLLQNASRQQSLPTNFTDLVQSMLKYNADERPTIDELSKRISHL